MGEQECQLVRPLGAPGDCTTNQRIHMDGPMAPAAYGPDGVQCPNVGECQGGNVGVGCWGSNPIEAGGGMIG